VSVCSLSAFNNHIVTHLPYNDINDFSTVPPIGIDGINPSGWSGSVPEGFPNENTDVDALVIMLQGCKDISSI